MGNINETKNSSTEFFSPRLETESRSGSYFLCLRLRHSISEIRERKAKDSTSRSSSGIFIEHKNKSMLCDCKVFFAVKLLILIIYRACVIAQFSFIKTEMISIIFPRHSPRNRCPWVHHILLLPYCKQYLSCERLETKIVRNVFNLKELHHFSKSSRDLQMKKMFFFVRAKWFKFWFMLKKRKSCPSHKTNFPTAEKCLGKFISQKLLIINDLDCRWLERC